jgi:hypothetical protein
MVIARLLLEICFPGDKDPCYHDIRFIGKGGIRILIVSDALRASLTAS